LPLFSALARGRTFPGKMLPDLGRNLAICHFVNRFNCCDEAAAVFCFQAFFQLTLGLARAKY